LIHALHSVLDPWLTSKQEQRHTAETLYYRTRASWPPERDASANAELEKLRRILDDTRETQAAWRPDEPETYFEFMEHMYVQHSRVIEAEGEWNEILQARAHEFSKREEAEFEEMEERAQLRLREDAIEAAGRMFDEDAQVHQSHTQFDDEHDKSELYHTAIEDIDDAIVTKETDAIHQMTKVSLRVAVTGQSLVESLYADKYRALRRTAEMVRTVANV
jgi:hypothetical protein